MRSKIGLISISILVLAAVSAIESGLQAQTSQEHKGDLSGVWFRFDGTAFEIKEEPSMLPSAQALFEERKKLGDPLDPSENCFPDGVPRILARNRPFEIIQIPGRVLMLFETNHWVRQIYTDGRDHPEDLTPPTWMGSSIGRWEGDTLVVETIGANDRTWVTHQGHPRSEEMRVVERFRRVDQENMAVDITFYDPKTYEKPWSTHKTFRLKPDWEIWEHLECEFQLKLGGRQDGEY